VPVGFCFEVSADMQLALFKSRPENRGKIRVSRMWKYSRRPDHFGEVLI
jgi:steroid 5-alpha reductase family enzyme